MLWCWALWFLLHRCYSAESLFVYIFPQTCRSSHVGLQKLVCKEKFSVYWDHGTSSNNYYMKYNRMRRLPYIIEQEFGENTLELYLKLERTVLKISNYKNHRRFSLRCLSKDITPVIQKLKNNIGTYKSKCIIHNTERKLLNERIRNINNTIENLEHVKYMYENELKDTVSKELYKECEDYIEYAKETRLNKVLQRQVSKFERLIQKNSAEKSGCSKQCHSGVYIYSGNSSR